MPRVRIVCSFHVLEATPKTTHTLDVGKCNVTAEVILFLQDAKNPTSKCDVILVFGILVFGTPYSLVFLCQLCCTIHVTGVLFTLLYHFSSMLQFVAGALFTLLYNTSWMLQFVAGVHRVGAVLLFQEGVVGVTQWPHHMSRRARRRMFIAGPVHAVLRVRLTLWLSNVRGYWTSPPPWQSMDHRGTPASPGLVATLISDADLEVCRCYAGT